MITVLIAVVVAASSVAWGGELTVTNASMEELLSHAQRYGSTVEKRERRQSAREELFSRGAETLTYLMANIHIDNIAIHLLADEMVRNRLDPEDAVPVLLDALESEHDRTRKIAAYFLGFCDASQHADRLLALLDDEEAVGAAVRTLGKWKVDDAVEVIISHLHDDKERRRILAANALRDIGDGRAIPHLIDVLSDEYFTVRKAAARALVSLGEPAVEEVRRVLPDAEGMARREMMRIVTHATDN